MNYEPLESNSSYSYHIKGMDIIFKDETRNKEFMILGMDKNNDCYIFKTIDLKLKIKGPEIKISNEEGRNIIDRFCKNMSN